MITASIGTEQQIDTPLETQNFHSLSFIIPTLWVSNLLVARQHLNSFFQLAEYRGKVDQINPGNHFILAERGTPEALIKGLAWKIQQAGGECLVHGINNSLQNLVGEITAAKELTLQIIEFAQPYEQWSTKNDETNLTIKEAAEVARVAIALLPEAKKLIELGMLRDRCGEKSFDWNKLMNKLEQEFKQELERRGIKTSDDLDERLRLDLLALLNETDPIKKLRKRSEICSFYRLRTSDVEQALKSLSQRTSKEEVKVWGLDELFALESEGLQWLIPELLPKGETIILAAPPKAGKTLLAIDAAFAMATGEAGFLGQQVSRGKVLLISADESLTSTRAKLLKRGFRSGDNDIRVIPKWTIDSLDVLEKHLEDFRPDVVIIDSLRRITHGSQVSENSAEFADNIYTLKETIGRYGASGILIHHTNKNSEAMGVGKIRGSSAITGAVWGTWQLDHIPKPDPNNKKKLIIDPKDPHRVLSIFARDTEGQSFNIEFNPEDNSWIRSDEDTQAEQQTHRERIISVLTKNSHLPGLSGRDIIELLGMTQEEGRAIYSELNRMINKRLLSYKPSNLDKRINIYSLPVTLSPIVKQGDSPPPPLIDPIAEYLSQNHIQQDFNNTQQNTQQVFNNYSAENLENQSAEDLNAVTTGDSAILSNSSTKGGECVSPLQSDHQYDCKEENISKETNTEVVAKSYSVGDKVEVVNNREYKGKKLVISTIDDSGIWLREQKSGFNRPYGPFQPEQLRKC